MLSRQVSHVRAIHARESTTSFKMHCFTASKTSFNILLSSHLGNNEWHRRIHKKWILMLHVFFVPNCELMVESLCDIVMGKHKWNFLMLATNCGVRKNVRTNNVQSSPINAGRLILRFIRRNFETRKHLTKTLRRIRCPHCDSLAILTLIFFLT